MKNISSTTTRHKSLVLRFPDDAPTEGPNAAAIHLCDAEGFSYFDWPAKGEVVIDQIEPADRLVLAVLDHRPDRIAELLAEVQPRTFQGVDIGEGGASGADLTAIADQRVDELRLGWRLPRFTRGYPTYDLCLPADPEVFAKLQHLERFEVHRTGFSNEQLHALGSRDRIRTLALTTTGVTGAAIASGGFHRLTDLQLAEHKTLYQDLTFLNHLPTIQRLALRGVLLRPDNLAALEACTGLVDLDLSYNPIGSSSLAALGVLHRLQSLDLAGTKTNDDSVGSLDVLRRLVNLELAATSVTDAGMHQLGRLRTVERLWLTRNDITDQGLATLVQVMPQLRRLDVSMTKVTVAGARHLRHLRRLVRLEISPAAINEELVEMLSGMPEMGEVALRGPGNSDTIWELMATIADTIGGAQYLGRV